VVLKSDLLKRIITASIALPLFYLYIAKLPPVFLFVLIAVVSVLAQIEFCAMYKTKKPLVLAGIAGGLTILASVLLSIMPFMALMLSFMFVSSVRLFYIKDPSGSLKDLAPVITGIIYIPCLLGAQLYLGLIQHEWILFLYGCVWASDSLAYFIGTKIGHRKLYKEVSPNKTVEGAFGSIAGGIISSIILGTLLIKTMSIPKLVIMGACIGAVTIIGDLVESMFKRDAGVKDSGSIIPGHGGILDKIDGSLFAAPVLYGILMML
jgi:phosphatidate cytidylyltransferase